MSRVTFEQVKEFITPKYKHERLYGRNGNEWGADYSERVIQGYVDDLNDNGCSLISHHESATGKIIDFTIADVIGDTAGTPRIAVKKRLRLTR